MKKRLKWSINTKYPTLWASLFLPVTLLGLNSIGCVAIVTRVFY